MQFCKHKAVAEPEHQSLVFPHPSRTAPLAHQYPPLVRWDGTSNAEVRPSLLCLCQASRPRFAASSGQGFLSEHCFHFQAAPRSRRRPVPPSPPQGLKNKQGGTRSPPDLGGHGLLLAIFFLFFCLFFFPEGGSAALAFPHSRAIPRCPASLLILCMICRGLVPRRSPPPLCPTPLPALGKLLPLHCY